MILYAVMHWFIDEDIETTNLVAIFSDRWKAEDYIDRTKGYPANDDWYIVERELGKEY